MIFPLQICFPSQLPYLSKDPKPRTGKSLLNQHSLHKSYSVNYQVLTPPNPKYFPNLPSLHSPQLLQVRLILSLSSIMITFPNQSPGLCRSPSQSILQSANGCDSLCSLNEDLVVDGNMKGPRNG